MSSFFEGPAAEAPRRPPVELPKHSDNPVLVIGGGASVVPAMEAYKSLRTRLLGLQTGRGIRSVVITSAAYADGKTLLSLNLAWCCAQLEDTPVLLVDADLRSRGLTELIGNLSQPGLTDVLSGAVSYEDAICRTSSPNLYVIGAGSSAIEMSEIFSGENWKRFMDWARNFFKLVLVDSLPIGTAADCELIAAGCDGVMVVVRAQMTPRGALEKGLEQIESNKLIGVVWNAAPGGSSAAKAYRQHAAKSFKAVAE